MLELKTKLSAGNLADFTADIRRSLELPVTASWDDIFQPLLGAMPTAEAGYIIIKAGRVAGFFEDGQAPSDKQAYSMSYDEVTELAERIADLFMEWHQIGTVSSDEKKS